MDLIRRTTMTIVIIFHPTFVQTSRRVHSQDLHCNLALLRVLLVDSHHPLTLEEEDQIAYSLHQDHEDLDYHQEHVDHLQVDQHHVVEVHLDLHPVKPDLVINQALLQRTD